MKRILLSLPMLLLPISAAGRTKAPPKPIKLVLSPASTVSSADVLKNLRAKCPNVSITLDSVKSDFMLEAGGWPGHYEFTVFKHGGDAAFSTTTYLLSNAVKDVCKYVNAPKKM